MVYNSLEKRLYAINTYNCLATFWEVFNINFLGPISLEAKATQAYYIIVSTEYMTTKTGLKLKLMQGLRLSFCKRT